MKEEKTRGTMLTSTALILCCVTFGAGFLCGDLVAEYRAAGTPRAQVAAPAQPAPVKPAQPAAKVSEADEAARAAAHIAELRARAEKDPGNADLWTHLGNVCYDSGDRDGAIDAYRRSLAIAPGNADVMTDMGSMYRMKGQTAEAVKIYEQAIALKPGHTNAIFNKGVTLMLDMARPAAAMDFWKGELAKHPDITLGSGAKLGAVLHEIALDAAMQLESHGLYDAALAAYAEAQKVKPDFVPALIHNAWLLENMKRQAEALPLWKRVLELQPDAYDPAGKPVRDHIR